MLCLCLIIAPNHEEREEREKRERVKENVGNSKTNASLCSSFFLFFNESFIWRQVPKANPSHLKPFLFKVLFHLVWQVQQNIYITQRTILDLTWTLFLIVFALIGIKKSLFTILSSGLCYSLIDIICYVLVVQSLIYIWQIYTHNFVMIFFSCLLGCISR